VEDMYRDDQQIRIEVEPPNNQRKLAFS